MANRVRQATKAESSWFKQNELRAQEMLSEVMARKGNARFAGLDRNVAHQVKAYLDSVRPRGVDGAKLRRMMQSGDLPPLRIPTTAVTTSFMGEILDGIHVPGDTYKIALYVAASTIGPATTAYTATNEASGTGYTAGGMNMAGRQIVLDGTTQILDWTTDPVWANATITARGCMIYNSTKANRSVGVFDFGADVSSTNGNFTVTLPAPTAAAGLIRLA